jgi:hypothetical protein
MTSRRLSRVLVALSGVVLLSAVACGSGGSTQTVNSGGSPPATHRLSEGDGGSPVQARVGDRIVVTLHSTYWQLAEPAGPVLVANGRPESTAGGPSCSTVPGSGCGTIRAEYRAAAVGSTRIEADRQSCGEALRCTGRQGRWSVTVVVSR